MKAGAFVVLAALSGVIAYLKFGMVITDGIVVKAEVLRVGTYPAGGVAGGNLPIVTVRLPDGSVRQVQATWADFDNCSRGRWLSLIQHGPALLVGKPGCSTA
jgi:hypothetical protein